MGESGEGIQARRHFEQAVESVLSFREALEHRAKAPIKEWDGGRDPNSGVLTLPYPKYHADILDFFTALSVLLSLWIPDATDYLDISEKFRVDHNAVAVARPDEVKALLTFVLRGEKYCDGFWGTQLSSGSVIALLERLEELYQSGETTRST